MSRMYSTMQYANENTTNYLVIFCHTHKVNEALNGIRITRGVQKYGMKILFLIHATGFDALSDYSKKEEDT